MENQELVRVEWRNQPVLPTNQLAERYGCEPKNIANNFKRAKEYFIEGVHYYKLTGEELRQFKSYSSKSGMAIHPYAAWVYLWTYQGCARHCKMINTPKAWEVFNVLEQAYFGMPQGEAELPAPPTAENEEVIRLRKQLAGIEKFEFAVVYLLLMGNGTVKIGYTGDLTQRVKQIKAETRLDVLQYKTSAFMSLDAARAKEAALKEKYAADCLVGEYFDVRFVDICKEI